MLVWLGVALVSLVGLFLVLQGDRSTAEALDGFMPYVGGGLLLAYAILLLSRSGGRASQVVKGLAAWAGIMLALVAGYAYREDVQAIAYRVMGELAPPGAGIPTVSTENGERAVRVRRRPDGHFMARVDINGASIPMLVDTGASTVVLKPADAERAGVDTKALAYSVPVQTANGTAYAAPVRLRSISIGGIEVRDVETLVSKPGSLKESLLGMSFLKRLRSYEFSGEFLTLRS